MISLLNPTLFALLLLIIGVSSQTDPTVTHLCTYNSKLNSMTMSVTATPGSRGIYQMAVVDANLNPSCFIRAPTNNVWTLSYDVYLSTASVSDPTCISSVRQSSGFYELRVLVQQHERFLLSGDKFVLLKCNEVTSVPVVLTTGEVAVKQMVATELININAEMTFYVAGETNNIALTTVGIHDRVRLIAGMKIPNAQVGGPIGMHLSNCRVGPTQTFPDPPSIFFVDSNGCPLYKGAFEMSSGFGKYTGHSSYDITISNNGIYYIAVTPPFGIGQFSGYDSLFFQCEVTLCTDTFDSLCFDLDHCILNSRKKRAEPAQNTTILTTAVFVTTSPLSDSVVDNDNCVTNVSEEDCFPSWIFVVVVVVLILLLVFSVLISFCILYRLNRKVYDTNEKS